MESKLKTLRVEHDLTVEYVAKIVGACKKSISNYENLKSKPSYTVMLKLAELYSVPISYIKSDYIEIIKKKSK